MPVRGLAGIGRQVRILSPRFFRVLRAFKYPRHSATFGNLPDFGAFQFVVKYPRHSRTLKMTPGRHRVFLPLFGRSPADPREAEHGFEFGRAQCKQPAPCGITRHNGVRVPTASFPAWGDSPLGPSIPSLSFRKGVRYDLLAIRAAWIAGPSPSLSFGSQAARKDVRGYAAETSFGQVRPDRCTSARRSQLAAIRSKPVSSPALGSSLNPLLVEGVWK